MKRLLLALGLGLAVCPMVAHATPMDDLAAHLSSYTDSDGHLVLRLTGVNLQLVDGSGTTDSQLGLAVLVIGYDDPRPGGKLNDGVTTCKRNSSHSIRVGRAHCTQDGYGQICAGLHNDCVGDYSECLDGQNNAAITPEGGAGNVQVGGADNIAGSADPDDNATYVVGVGGKNNLCASYACAQLGGNGNVIASLGPSTTFHQGQYAVGTGGTDDLVTGDFGTGDGGWSDDTDSYAGTTTGGYFAHTTGFWADSLGGAYLTNDQSFTVKVGPTPHP